MKVEVAAMDRELPVPNSPYDLYGCKATPSFGTLFQSPGEIKRREVGLGFRS